jgi:hypothetical protein
VTTPTVIVSEGGSTVEVNSVLDDPRTVDIVINQGSGTVTLESVTESVEVTTEQLVQDVVLTAGMGIAGPPGPPGAAGSGHRFYGEGPPGVVFGAAPDDEYVDALTGDLYVLE